MAEPRVVALCKVVPSRVDVDAVTGQVTIDDRELQVSAADRAAATVARALADRAGWPLEVVCVAPAAADATLVELAAAVGGAATRIELGGGATLAPSRWLAAHPSAVVAAALADELRGARYVVAGDHSLDRGSGTVPARVAARLELAQLLGLCDVDLDRQIVTRRLHRGWREELALPASAVLSVEGALGAPPRASLARLRGTEVRVVHSDHHVREQPLTFAPYRAPTRVVAPPDDEVAARRAMAVIGALATPRRRETVELDPRAAAQLIRQRLLEWGYA